MPKKQYKGDGFAFYKIVKGSGKTIAEVQKELGISNGTLYNYYESETLADDVKDLISKWANVEFGENYISHVTEGDRIRRQKAIGRREQKKVPVLGEAAAGTELEINTTDMTTYPDQYIDVGDLLRDSEAAFTVYGNSMTPNYPSGAVLGLKRNYDGFIQPGEIYVLETKSNRVFKRLYWNEDKSAYVCVSDNTMMHETGPRKGKYFYEPFDIPISDVMRMFDVTGVIKRTRNSGIIQRIN